MPNQVFQSQSSFLHSHPNPPNVSERAGIDVPSVSVAQGKGFSYLVLYHSSASRAILIITKHHSLSPITDMPRHIHFFCIARVQLYNLRVTRTYNQSRT